MIGLRFTGRRASCLWCHYSWRVKADGKLMRHTLYVGRLRVACQRGHLW